MILQIKLAQKTIRVQNLRPMTVEKPIVPAWLDSGKRLLAPMLLLAILFAAAWRENRNHPLDFWSHSEGYGDYVTICLAHALNIDFWVSQSPLHSRRAINDNNTLHPGFPLQAASWAAYRLASLGKGSNAATRCESVFNDAADFWLSIRLLAIAIGMVSSVLLVRAAYPLGLLYSLAVGLIYFCYEPAWDYSIRLLGNETFALPLSIAVAWVAYRSLNPSGTGSVLKWWAGWGSLCALCWLNKLNYIAWTAAAVPAGVIYFAVNRPTLREMGLRLVVFAGGFVTAAWSISTVMLGPGGLEHILRLHFGVLTHAGSYGNGPAGAVSASAVREALQALAAYRGFLLLAAGVGGLAGWVLFSNARKGRNASGDAAFIVYLLGTAGLFFAAVLKHYGAHYLIAGVPALSLLLLTIGGHLNARVRTATGLVTCLMLVSSYRQYWAVKTGTYSHATAIKSSLRVIDHLPGRPGDGTLWSYRLPDRRFGLELVQFLAGVPEVAAVIDDKFAVSDKAYFLWLPTVRNGTESIPFEKAQWRYAVFDRGHFDFFLNGSQAGAKEYFEQHCKRIINGPRICVYERLEQ